MIDVADVIRKLDAAEQDLLAGPSYAEIRKVLPTLPEEVEAAEAAELEESLKNMVGGVERGLADARAALALLDDPSGTSRTDGSTGRVARDICQYLDGVYALRSEIDQHARSLRTQCAADEAAWKAGRPERRRKFRQKSARVLLLLPVAAAAVGVGLGFAAIERYWKFTVTSIAWLLLSWIFAKLMTPTARWRSLRTLWVDVKLTPAIAAVVVAGAIAAGTLVVAILLIIAILCFVAASSISP